MNRDPREDKLANWVCEDQMDITDLIEQDVPQDEIEEPK